jgi:AcrR family transcriptional regulator
MSEREVLRPVPAAPEPEDGRRAKGERFRQAALTEAVQLASVEGLEGLSIGRLADQLGVAKSSVHAAFGGKEALQLATLQRARAMLIEVVVLRALAVAPEPGRDHLLALGDTWFAYLEGEVFAGGCLFMAASAEMDGRPGPARDKVAEVMAEWLQYLAENVQAAVDRGELDPRTDPDQLAFELNGIGMAANWHHQLIAGPATFARARTAWANALRPTPSGR